MVQKPRHIGLLLLLLALLGCGGQPPPATQSAGAQPSKPAAAGADTKGLNPGSGPADGEGAAIAGAAAGEGEADDAPGGPGAAAARGGAPGAADTANPIPVSAADPALGNASALVTLVVFSDFQCPFCARAAATVAELRRLYGPDKLRIVWKNNPLPFHPKARPAAETAMALYEAGGAAWFWEYHDAIFSSRQNKEAIEDALKRSKSRLTQEDIDRIRQRGAVGRKIDEDIALARRVGALGTPAFFINGVFLSGAQPIEEFRPIIDQTLAQARELVAGGVPPAQVYRKASAQNFEPPKPRAPASPPPEDKTVWLVPVGKSPVRGKPTALVTIVEFSDFQCPFCSRVETTLDAVLRQYGDKVRLVWKNNPLPFHPRAEPSAQLALEARAQKGDAAFWTVHDELFARQKDLSDPELEAIAKSAGLNAGQAMKAVLGHKHKALIEEDVELSDDLEAHGTPHLFINGRRLVGAQPIEKFQEIIDEELAKAEKLVAGGVAAARVYETIQKQATPPPPPKKINLPPPTQDSPAKGPVNAKVQIQIFSDFECPFCKRAADTLTQLEAEFPGKLRFVWRNMPLSMHKNAQPAAEAALEVRTQKGDAAFWKMHDLLFKSQGRPDGLDRASLEQHAVSLGVSATKFREALDTGAHKAAIEGDKKVAETAGIRGTPAFSINGYFVSGAQPLTTFRRLVKRALSETK